MTRNKIFLIIWLILLAVLLVGAGIWALRLWDQKQLDEVVPINQNSSQPIVGNDVDSYGCLTSAGYGWCEASQKCLRIFEEFCPDMATGLVGAVRQNTGIVFTGPVQKSFNWVTGDETTQADVAIDGLSFQAENLTMNGVTTIENFLNSLAQTDSFNLADGVVGGQRGYYFNYMACLYNFRNNEQVTTEATTTEATTTEVVNDTYNVELSCGYFNPNDMPQIITQQKIRELFAQKYDRSTDEVTIAITTSTADHMRGSVKFGDGTKGEGGIFFAAKVDNEWKLVFDGNGMIPCNLLTEYKFPDDFQTDCAPLE